MKHIHNRTKYFIDGVPAIDVARQHGIKVDCIYGRLRAGWNLKEACTTKKNVVQRNVKHFRNKNDKNTFPFAKGIHQRRF